MISLRGRHKDQTLTVVGKGPSLEYLSKDDFVPGPVIAINHAIIAVEELGLSNAIYAMQKDGGRKRTHPNGIMNPECEHSDNCDDCGGKVRPKKAILLVHRHESLYCFSDYSPRYVFDWDMLGLPGNECSFIFAIQMGKLFACNGFRFISFDAHTNGNRYTYIPGSGLSDAEHPYESQVPKIDKYINGYRCEWITPK